MTMGSKTNDLGYNESLISFNSTGRANSVVPEPPLYLLVVLSIVFSFIFLMGVSGNILVTTVVLRGKTLRTSVNYYVVSLCVADLLVIILCMPTAWVDVYAKDVWYFGEAMCKLVPFLENLVAGASVFTILFICVERHKAICQPFHRSNSDACRVLKTISVIWILSGSASLPFLFLPVFKESVWLDGTPIKVCRHPIRYTWQRAYLVAVPIVFFVLPFLIILALYCMVGRVLFPDKANTCNLLEENYRAKMKQRRQGINTVVLIVAIFFVSHLPYRVVSLWLIFESREVLLNLGLEAYLGVLYSARVAFYLNHALNPIIYNCVSRKFRTELNHTCRCCLTIEQNANNDTTELNSRSRLTEIPHRRYHSNEVNQIQLQRTETGNSPAIMQRLTGKRQFSEETKMDASDSGTKWCQEDNLSSYSHKPDKRLSRKPSGNCSSLLLFLRTSSSGFTVGNELISQDRPHRSLENVQENNNITYV